MKNIIALGIGSLLSIAALADFHIECIGRNVEINFSLFGQNHYKMELALDDKTFTLTDQFGTTVHGNDLDVRKSESGVIMANIRLSSYQAPIGWTSDFSKLILPYFSIGKFKGEFHQASISYSEKGRPKFTTDKTPLNCEAFHTTRPDYSNQH